MKNLKLILYILTILILITSCNTSPDRNELFELTDSIIYSFPSTIDINDLGKVQTTKELTTNDEMYEIRYRGRLISIYVNIDDEVENKLEYEELKKAFIKRYSLEKRVNEVILIKDEYGYSLEIDCYTMNLIQKELDINDEFVMGWSGITNNNFADIVKILVKNKIRMCGEFYWKESEQSPNKYLIACTPDGINFNIFKISTIDNGWIKSVSENEKAKLKMPY